MKYFIPTNKVEKLEKIINKYNKKGANITFNLGNKVTEKGTLTILDHIHHCQYETSIDVECVEVFVEGTYKINDWQFLGTIEFTSNGNIIRLVDSSFENKVPSKYLHTPQICEHCGTIRNRKDTYLIYNEKTNEFKQVGSTCLLDYTQGLDADACASMMSCFSKIKELSNYDCDSDSFKGNGYDATGYGMKRDTVLPITYAYVKQYGYEKMYQGNGTANDIMIMLWHGMHDEEMTRRYESLVMPTDEELKAVDEYAQSKLDSEQFGYFRNASLAWLNKSIEYRDFSLVASFVNTYFKELARLEKEKINAESRSNSYVGNIGDKITIQVKSARVLYIKDNSMYSYYAESTKVWEIIDTEGHTYKWSANFSIDIKSGDTIVATVKSFGEYKGIKQTVITRGKVLDK